MCCLLIAVCRLLVMFAGAVVGDCVVLSVCWLVLLCVLAVIVRRVSCVVYCV